MDRVISKGAVDAGDASWDTLPDLLSCRAARQPDEVAFRFLSFPGEGPADIVPISYGRLNGWARAIAARLLKKNEPGDRVLLLCPPGPDYIASFLGCLYAGMIAVPAYPPASKRQFARLEAIAADSQPAVIIVGMSDDLDGIEAFGGGSQLQSTRQLLAASVVRDEREDGFTAELDGCDSVAFLQYTSGSTGTPKGVMVTHANLLANARAAAAAFDMSSESVGVSWAPPYHDMGLIGGIIYPLYAGFPCMLMSPVSFIRDPARWLETITEYRATVSSGPSFSYQMCVDRIPAHVRRKLDLSSWTCALNGAEPVRPDVMRAFSEAFSTAGFRASSFNPCYGLAEATLAVSGRRDGGAPAVRYVSRAALSRDRFQAPEDLATACPLVGSGVVVPGTEVVIINRTTGMPAKPGGIGEIWVRGPGVAAGYFRDTEATETTFRAHSADGTGPFLRTGDLGVIVDSQLYVTGRASDLMIFHGRNIYPQDVETVCEQSHPALATTRTAAFSIDTNDGESLVVVQELPRRTVAGEEIAAIAAAIRRAVSENLQLQIHDLVFVPPRKIPVTSSGKVRRQETKALHAAAKLSAIDTDADLPHGASAAIPATPPAEPTEKPPVAQVTASQIERHLAELIARHGRCEPAQVSMDEPVAAYGLNSVQMVAIAADLSNWLGKDVPATLAWDYATIGTAVRSLATCAPRRAAHTVARPGVEPVAVIGAGCRFPGRADSLERFRELLLEGRTGVVPVPEDRWDAEEFFDPAPGTPGRTCLKVGGFLDDVRRFDAHLFGISPQEAAAIDPMHGLALEVAWQALENAGLAPDSLRGTRTGVFFGAGASDFARLGADVALTELDGYSATGVALNFVANRVSYTLGLGGPSLVVDTACSSSLVALHLAVQALRSGDCDLALAGGVNVLLAPEVSVALSQGRMLSPSGACRTFDASADGYVRGEGCGVVVLKRLSGAEADGDRVLGIIAGSAVNQDGRSNGLTAPSGTAQVDVITRAAASADVAPGEIRYLEAHGTGTPLGDPIEVRALARALRPDRGRPLAIGSVKTNLGHLEAAAGIAGFLKTLLIVHDNFIYPHINLTKLSPHIPWDDLQVTVPTSLTEWPEARRVAGVSSFGFGGTNAHVIVENARAAS